MNFTSSKMSKKSEDFDKFCYLLRKNEYQMNNASIGEIRGSINQIMHKDPYQREATKASFSKRLDFANVTKV